MSRKGWSSSLPSRTSRMRPVCSTMNVDVASSGRKAMSTGLSRPSRTFWMAIVGAVPDGGALALVPAGVEVADEAAGAEALPFAVGPDDLVGLGVGPAHPATAAANRSSAAIERCIDGCYPASREGPLCATDFCRAARRDGDHRRKLMDVWKLDDLEAARTESGRLYHEFLSVPDLSGGLYVL